MKTILLSILAAATLAPAIAQTPPGNLPMPDPAVLASNRQYFMERRRAAMAQTNAAAAPTPATASNSLALPARASRPLSAARPGNILTPVNTNAASGRTSTGGTNAQLQAISPLPGVTNVSGDDIIEAGMIDFRGADLAQVLSFYANLVNRTVLRPASLPAVQINLTTQGDLTRREAIQALDAVLGLNQITMMNVGEKFVKAVPQTVAIQEGQAFSKADASQLPELGQFVSHVVQLKYAKPTELVAALTPFAKNPAGLLPIDSSQIIVLRDYSENVKRMLELIKEIDVQVPSEYESDVIPIKYAQASEIAGALNSLSSGGGGGATVGTGGAANTGARQTSSRMGGSRMGGFGNRGGYGGNYGGSYGGNYGGNYGGYSPYAAATQPITTPGVTAAPGASFTDRLRNIMQRAAQGTEIQVLGQTKIIADERTNSLLVYASREDMKKIKEIIAKLDVVLAQVLIEAVILQVSLGDNMQLGVSYLEKKAHGGNYFNGIGAINNGNLLNPGMFSAITNSSSSGPRGGFSYLASLGGDLDIAVTAIAGDNRAKVLQRPRIQTSHNEPASIFVGESRPYPTSSYYGGGAYGGYSSIQQIPIGVTLQVTPLINPDGLVVMEINQDVQAVNGSVNIANVGEVPITSQKSASAKVSVRDRDTIMLGGLIETTDTKSASGVPVLKDIPLLGYLFRSSNRNENRNELIVLIRPTVLPTPEVAALTAKAEKDRMPLIKKADAEIEASEAQRLNQVDRELENMRKTRR